MLQMNRKFLLWFYALLIMTGPLLACRVLSSQQVTPTPTKTPRPVKLMPATITPTSTPMILPTPAVAEATEAVPTDTPIPEPPTPTPEPPTDTPPPPTDTPLPLPPPTNTPAPPPPTNTPAPPPPTQPPPSSGPEVIVQLPNGNDYSPGDKIKLVFIVRDPDGVARFTWGIFLQNGTALKGGDKECNGAVECSEEREERAPIPGTYIVGADAVDSKGNTKRGVGEIYVN
jgi:hypothetical protein